MSIFLYYFYYLYLYMYFTSEIYYVVRILIIQFLHNLSSISISHYYLKVQSIPVFFPSNFFPFPLNHELDSRAELMKVENQAGSKKHSGCSLSVKYRNFTSCKPIVQFDILSAPSESLYLVTP